MTLSPSCCPSARGLVGKTVTELSGHRLVDPIPPEPDMGSLGQEVRGLGTTLSFLAPPLRTRANVVSFCSLQNGRSWLYQPLLPCPPCLPSSLSLTPWAAPLLPAGEGLATCLPLMSTHLSA